MPRRAAQIGLLVAVLVALVACGPIDPDNRPTTVAGTSNGWLPPELLTPIAGDCAVYREAGDSLRAMITAANRDGVRLQAGSCYRDYAGQVQARNDWCSRGQCEMAAVPGQSNHGWGKAVDFRDQGGSLTFDSPGYRWMKDNAWLYGWNHPGVMEPDGPVPEPWHWEWVGDGGRMYPGWYWGVGNVSPIEGDNPVGSLDAASVQSGRLRVAGWAIDPNTAKSIEVHVWVDGAIRGSGRTTVARPDVDRMLSAWAGSPHGYALDFPAQPGDRQVCVFAINVGAGDNAGLGCRNL